MRIKRSMSEWLLEDALWYARMGMWQSADRKMHKLIRKEVREYENG